MPYRASFDFAAPPEELWQLLSRVDRFESWWSWLSEFEATESELRAGTVLSGVVTPPLPYRIRVEVAVQECVASSYIRALVRGDLVGPAMLWLTAATHGSTATVEWQLEMMQRSMRLASRVAFPLLRWGHERVVEATAASLGGRPSASGGA
jgi:carbon monoxide dehydrogenase subunit G